MKFSEMKYTRPDPKAVIAQMQAFTQRLKNAKSYAEARGVFLEEEEWNKHPETMGTLAYIRHSIDTRDQFYDGEIAFWDEIGPELEEYQQEWRAALERILDEGEYRRMVSGLREYCLEHCMADEPAGRLLAFLQRKVRA